MKKFMTALCTALMLLCVSFTFTGCEFFSDNDNKDDTEKFAQYYMESCPIELCDNANGVSGSSINVNFWNVSDKKIIAYEVIFILYNVYDVQLTPMFSDSPYYKQSYTPTNFAPEHNDFKDYNTMHSDLYYAEVYIYYVLFEDKTSWGCRENISNETITKLATKYKVERYSY